VLRTDVQAPGIPVLRLMQVSVDPARGVVRAGLFGFIGGGLAVFRPETGCTVMPDGKLRSVADNALGSAAAPSRGRACAPSSSFMPDIWLANVTPKASVRELGSSAVR
jgi:hypothetical protein